MPDVSKKHKVFLSAEYRAELEAICRRKSVAAAKVRRARILLMSDESHPGGRRPDSGIAEAVGLCERQVVRIRQQFVRDGEPALDYRPRPSRPGKLDGPAEAHLVTICCSRPPAGRDRWTLELLCDELVRLTVVESICRETVRQCLKKTNLNLGGRNGSAFRKKTVLASSPIWKKSWMSTKSRTTAGTR